MQSKDNFSHSVAAPSSSVVERLTGNRDALESGIRAVIFLLPSQQAKFCYLVGWEKLCLMLHSVVSLSLRDSSKWAAQNSSCSHVIFGPSKPRARHSSDTIAGSRLSSWRQFFLHPEGSTASVNAKKKHERIAYLPTAIGCHRQTKLC